MIAELLLAFSPVNYTPKQTANLRKAEVVLAETVAGKCFEDVFLNRKQFVQSNGKTRAEVVADIRSFKANLPVKMYYSSAKVIGYRNTGSPTIYTNSKYHAKYSACSIAANLAHEAAHVMGYPHDFKVTKRRPYSVPYTVSAAFNICCKESK